MDWEISLFVSALQSQILPAGYSNIAAASVMMYDYILTLHLEIRLIWFSPWNYTKVLFLLTRYVPMGLVWLLICDELFYISDHACSLIRPALVWLSIIGMSFAEVILAIRTWAVWGRDRRIGLGLAVLLVGGLILECFFANRSVNTSESVPRPYPEFTACLTISVSEHGDILWECFVVLAVVEGVILALMVISAFRSYRPGNNNELSNVIHRDGILFYAYLSALTITNTICIRILSLEVLVEMQSVLYSVLTSRIIFNIRTVAQRTEDGITTELHAVRPMKFRVRDDKEDEDWMQPLGNIEDAFILEIKSSHIV